jgi:hypothetical protein
MVDSTDVVVIGGGYAGVLAARYIGGTLGGKVEELICVGTVKQLTTEACKSGAACWGCSKDRKASRGGGTRCVGRSTPGRWDAARPGGGSPVRSPEEAGRAGG